MAFTVPYTSLDGSTQTIDSYMSTLQDSSNQVTLWRKDLAHESTKMMFFNPLMGKGPLNCIQHFPELQSRQGISISTPLMKRIAASDNRPFQGDYDTHGVEVTIADTQESVTLKEWRLPAMSGRAEKQKPMWNYDVETEFAIKSYVSDMKDLHILEQSIGVTSYDGMTTPVAIFSGETPTNIVYPEGTDSLDDIQPSHILNVESFSRAAEIMETGFSDSNTQVWVGRPPSIGGEAIRGVAIIHPYCKYDLRWDDTQRFESWLTDARERGKSNPVWQGIPDKFVCDGILYITARYPLANEMLRTASTWSVTPGCQVAFNIYMTAQAILRATAIEDILDFENWDGQQFLRVVGGSYEGITKCRFDRSSSNNKDYGIVQVPVAAYHHND